MRLLSTVMGMVLSFSVFAADNAPLTAPKFKEGVHYQVLNAPLRTTVGTGKIEVAELFWYGCGHCYTFEPTINDWKKSKPDNAELVKVPSSWGPAHAKLFYTAEMLGVLDQAHGKIFAQMHNDPKRRPNQVLSTEKEIKAFFLSMGITEEQFNREYNGGSVKMAMSFADSNIRSLSKQMGQKGVKISTPSMIVNGKYYVSLNQQVPKFKDMLEVTDFLVAKESK